MALITDRTQSSPPIPRPARPSPEPARPFPEPARPSPERVRPSPEPARLRGPALALILTAAFMVVLDFSIVNVALPSIETELGFPADAVQWIITAYAISFGGLLILGGRAAPVRATRRPCAGPGRPGPCGWP
jgi:hypothetical protein